MRDDVRRGLRVIGLERRAPIAFHVAPAIVMVLRILYAGRGLTGASPPDE